MTMSTRGRDSTAETSKTCLKVGWDAGLFATKRGKGQFSFRRKREKNGDVLVEERLDGEESADVALIGSAESVKGVGVPLREEKVEQSQNSVSGSLALADTRSRNRETHLSTVVSLADLVVQHDQHTPATRVRRDGDGHSGEKVVGSVGGDGGGGTHGAL
jgi:hypothetical protein